MVLTSQRLLYVRMTNGLSNRQNRNLPGKQTNSANPISEGRFFFFFFINIFVLPYKAFGILVHRHFIHIER